MIEGYFGDGGQLFFEIDYQLTEILLGSRWLEFLPLVVNFPDGVLILG